MSVLPGRHPVLVAKQLTSLAGLAPRPGAPGVRPAPARPPGGRCSRCRHGRRAAVFDESLALLRQLLTGQTVSFDGRFFTVEAASVGPAPAKPLDIWLGGCAPAALRRVGVSGTAGWAASCRRPRPAGRGEAIDQAAAAGRAGDGGRPLRASAWPWAPTGCRRSCCEASTSTAVRTRTRHAWPRAAGTAARDLIDGYIEAGLTKFVVRPASEPESFGWFVDAFVRELMPLQN